MTNTQDDYVLTLNLGPCQSIAPIQDEVGNDIQCIFDLFHKGTHYGPTDSFPSREQSQVKWDDVIAITGSMRNKGGATATCTCGWSFGPSTEIGPLGTEAFQHRNETGHKLRVHGDHVG